jgi:hypothetical protein
MEELEIMINDIMSDYIKNPKNDQEKEFNKGLMTALCSVIFAFKNR